jgi:signal transduction histidine kinase
VKNPRLRYVTILAILFIAYFVTARLGLSLDAVSGFATVVWPPTGIALVAILILGHRYWPGIFLSAFLVNVAVGAPLFVALGIGVGNTLEALVGAYLLSRLGGFRPALDRTRDVVSLVVLAALFSPIVSATIGVTSLWAGGIIAANAYMETWAAWWVGDALGTLVIAPLLFAWIARPRFVFSLKRLAEAMVLMVALVGVSLFAFHASLWTGDKPFTFVYIIFPLLIWIALRFRQRGSATAIFVVSIVAVWSAVAGSGVLSDGNLGQNLLLLQCFMGITAVTFMTMAAVVSEQAQTRRRQEQLSQKAEVLNKQRSRLLALNKAKDEFIAVASHQLRTPATGVKQYIHMLLENYAGKLTKPQRNLLLVANEMNEREIQVINDLLRVAQVDAGKVRLSLEKVDLVTLITDVIKSQASMLADRNQTIDFVTTGTFRTYADRPKVRMVIENLVDNASKYSHTDARLGIELSKANGFVAISIKDSGVGISRVDQAKLFKKFSRIENPQSAFVGGSGLGLYWAKRMIQLHGGSISVSSKLGEGSVFKVTIPVTSVKAGKTHVKRG